MCEAPFNILRIALAFRSITAPLGVQRTFMPRKRNKIPQNRVEFGALLHEEAQNIMEPSSRLYPCMGGASAGVIVFSSIGLA